MIRRAGIRFLSTPSARRATQLPPGAYHTISDFYPRPPRGGRPGVRHGCTLDVGISIHALREEGDLCQRHLPGLEPISIHALREEGDRRSPQQPPNRSLFLSTPSARRATHQVFKLNLGELISIHALREEGDSRLTAASCCGKIFLSTPSARRATAKTETKSLFSNKLYNILHEFRRALIYNGSKSYPNHAK